MPRNTLSNKQRFLLFLFFLNTCGTLFGLQDTSVLKDRVTTVKKPVKRINLIISSRVNKLDPATISFQAQAFLQRAVGRRNIHLVVAGSSEEMFRKAQKLLQREVAKIGNIWFDSHGHYGKRYSLFEIGNEEFNWMNLSDEKKTYWIGRLAPYCDSLTKAGIGSCYSGATYTVPAIDRFPPSRMGGDSLMVRLSRLLNQCEVYGSESWVMSKPGLFDRKFGLTGYPSKKRFLDVFLRPAWERIGVWNVYRGHTSEFNCLNGVYLTGYGDIMVTDKSYLQIAGKRNKIEKKLRRLRKGNFNLAYLYD